MSDLVFYFDMDGVLADWVGGFEALYPNIPYESLNNHPDYDKIREEIDFSDDFYFNLKPLPTVDVLKELRLFNYNVAILTSCGEENYDAVRKQKLEWVLRHIGDIDVITVKKSAEKALYANPSAILIDDRDKALIPFKAAGGLAIKYDKHYHNELYTELAPYLN